MHEMDNEAINAGTQAEDGYEKRDIEIVPLIKWTAGFFLGTTLTILAVVYIFKGVEVFSGSVAESRSVEVERPPYPNPILQSNITVKKDIMQMLREQDHALNSYGWVDPERGVAHIPIQRAMQILATQGMPEIGRPMTREEARSEEQPAGDQLRPARPAAGASSGTTL